MSGSSNGEHNDQTITKLDDDSGQKIISVDRLMEIFWERDSEDAEIRSDEELVRLIDQGNSGRELISTQRRIYQKESQNPEFEGQAKRRGGVDNKFPKDK